MQGVEVWLVAGHVGGVVIALAVSAAMLVVAVGPVRRHRPDVSGLFVAVAVLQIAIAIGAPILYAAGSLLAATALGAVGMVRATTLFGLAIGVVNAGITGLLIAGIARLAAPPRGGTREPV